MQAEGRAAGTDMGTVQPEAPESGAASDLQRRNAELEVLYATIRDLSSTLAVDEVIERLLDRTLLHLDAEIGSVLLADETGLLRVVLSRGLSEEVVATLRIAPGEDISGHVFETGEPLLISDIESDPLFSRRNREHYYTHSCISAPLRIDARVCGVLNVNNKRSREVFHPGDLRLLEAIAGHAAVSLSNAERFERMLELSRRDSLTGLANRGHFWDRLRAELSRSSRHGGVFSVVMADIDHFKSYNDEHGHVAGDGALQAVGQLLKQRSRVHDVVARYGGEEFAAILPETSQSGAIIFAEKLRDFVEGSDLGQPGRPGVTLSFGVASFPENGATAVDLVESADSQLYRAKAAGRNRVCAREL
jgi:diguanylate cyclase (GGDEF)-like protein